MNINLKLFLTFAKTGVTTFGGGLAMLPILQREVVDKQHWATEEELMDYYAIGQCTPGIIAVNTATFVGSSQNGLLGGIVATLGLVFPSLVIITVIAAFLGNFANVPAVQHAFAGIRVCALVLIINSILKLIKKAVIDIPTALIFVTVLALSIFVDLSPIIFVLSAGVIGVVVKAVSNWHDGRSAQ